MKRLKLKGSFFYIGLISTYLIVLGLMFAFFDNIAVRNSVITRYQMERTIFALVESFRQNQLAVDLEAAEGVKGFGIYRLDGTGIYTWKNAPEVLDPERIRQNGMMMHNMISDSGFVFDADRRSLKLTRQLMNMLPRGMGMRRMLLNEEQAPAFIYMEQETPDYWKSYRLLTIARYGLPVFLLIVMCIIAYLYRKNRDYKTRLAANTELIRLGEISRTLAHEIKNPLGAIRLQTGLLKKTLPGGHKEEIRIIEEEVRRLGTLTNRIADFLRDPVGNPEKISPGSFIKELIKRFDFDIRFTNDLPADTLIHFDKDRLRSVLENIIKNGIESYNNREAAGEAPYLEIRIRMEENYPAVSVLDRGSGISPEITARVINAAYTSKPAGSGIGLAIARRFIDAGSARIVFLAREGGGTEVKICFTGG